MIIRYSSFFYVWDSGLYHWKLSPLALGHTEWRKSHQSLFSLRKCRVLLTVSLKSLRKIVFSLLFFPCQCDFYLLFWHRRSSCWVFFKNQSHSFSTHINFFSVFWTIYQRQFSPVQSLFRIWTSWWSFRTAGCFVICNVLPSILKSKNMCCTHCSVLINML